jgi:four helix bundle protein
METGPRSLEKLEVWNEALVFSEKIYILTKRWPDSERFGLTPQLRRATVSIAANLAEGLGRGRAGEVSRFARIALGSAYEAYTLLRLAERLGFPGAYAEVMPELDRLTRRLSAYIRHWEERR